MSFYLSKKISNLQIICAILIVCIHATTWAVNLPGETTVIYGKNISTFIQMFIAEGVARIAVPLFFVISGYLFYINYQLDKKYIMEKYLKRFRTQVIPYIFWSLIVWIFYYIAQKIPVLSNYCVNRRLTGLKMLEHMRYILISPLNSPLWFLKDLIIMTIFSPIIYVIIKCSPYLWGVTTVLIWLFDANTYIVRPESFAFWGLGALFAVRLSGYVKKSHHINKRFVLCLELTWLVVLIVKSLYLCGLSADVLLIGLVDSKLEVLSKLNIVIGLIAVWYMYDYAVGDKVISIAEYSFLLYVTHHPVIAVLKKITMKIIGVSMVSSLMAYFLAITMTILLIIVVGRIAVKYTPRFYGVVTGNRK